MMLDLEPLPLEALRQVYEWDGGEKFEPFDTYAARLSRPSWTHYAILKDKEFIGAISLELTGPTMCSIHIAKKPCAGKLAELRQMIFSVADVLFKGGIQTLTADISSENRAARQLATLCGMALHELHNDRALYAINSSHYFATPALWP